MTNLYKLKIGAEKVEALEATLDAIDSATEAIQAITPSMGSIDTIATILDEIQDLADIKTELESLYADKTKLDSLYADKVTLDTLYSIKAKLDSLYADKIKLDSIYSDKTQLDEIYNNLTEILDAVNKAQTATEQAVIATNKASEASTSANNALTQANRAEGYADSITLVNTDTIATLRALLTAPTTVWVSGYHTKSDGAFGSHIFEWNSTSIEADNGGTIIKLDGVATGRYELRYDGAVNVKWFGAVGDGIVDDTVAMQNTIDYSAKNATEPQGGYNGGHTRIYIPQGLYKVTATLNLHNIIGLSITGDGAYTSKIFIDTTSVIPIFDFDTYQAIYTHGISFVHGSYLDGTIVYNTDIDRTANCLQINSGNTGTQIAFKECSFQGFSNVIKTANENNGDNVGFEDCGFFSNDNVCVTGGIQLLNWSFNRCKFYYNTGIIFDNPNSSWTISNIDSINPGVFINLNKQSVGLCINLENVYFETYQNIDATSNPIFLQTTGITSGYKISFYNCNISPTGGYGLGTKYVWDIKGAGDIIFRDCNISNSGGIMKTEGIDDSNKNPGNLIFENTTPPQLEMNTKTGYANMRWSVFVNNSNLQRSLIGSSFTINSDISRGNGNQKNIDVFNFNDYALNSVTKTSTRTVRIPNSGLKLIISGIKITLRQNTTPQMTFSLYSNSDKTKLLYTKLLPSSPNIYTVTEAFSEDIAHHEFSDLDEMAFEISSTAAAGYVSGKVEITYEQTFYR